MHHYKDNLEPDFQDYHYLEDDDELFLDKLRQYISQRGFIKFKHFEDLEVGYNVILIQKRTLGKPYMIYGRFLDLKDSHAYVEVDTKGLMRILTKRRILKLKSKDEDIELYGSSGSFDSWELLTNYLSEA